MKPTNETPFSNANAEASKRNVISNDAPRKAIPDVQVAALDEFNRVKNDWWVKSNQPSTVIPTKFDGRNGRATLLGQGSENNWPFDRK